MSDSGSTKSAATEGSPRVQEAWGARLTRDTALYVIGALIGFVLALLSIVVVTRFLDPAEFGQLALLLVFAAFLTVFYNVGTLQGTFIWVFGSAGEEDVEDTGEASQAGTKRRALGTGLLITVMICVVGTGLVALFASELANLFIGDSSKGDLIVIAALSGAAGAIWRLISNILRMERKPKQFVVLSQVRPILVVGFTIALVQAGGGIEGAIAGTAIGGGLSVLIGLIVTRRSFTLAIDRQHATMILKRGGIYVPILISLWVAQNVDIYALAWFTNNDQVVGLYRLASRYGAFLDYFTAALFMAWTPLRQTSAFQASVSKSGKEHLGGSLLSMFVLAGALIILLMTAGADTLVRIAPPEYAAAAPLIPLLGTAFLAYGLFISVYRLSTFPRKRLAYIGAAISAAVGFLATAPLWVPLFGAYGAALSVISGFAVAVSIMTYLSQRGPEPLEIEWARIAGGLLLGGACVAVARVFGPMAGPWQPLVETGAVVLYVVGLFVTGIFSKEDRQAIRRVAGQLMPKRSPAEIEERVRALPPEDAAALRLILRRAGSMESVALVATTETIGGETRLISVLDRIAGVSLEPAASNENGDSDTEAPAESGVSDDGGAAEAEAGSEAAPLPGRDRQIIIYLFARMPGAERDEMGRTLWASGVDPEYLHSIEHAVEGLRRLPKRVWAEARTSSGRAESPN
jgi:O-antigen/teichoic acid export membrane protein